MIMCVDDLVEASGRIFNANSTLLTLWRLLAPTQFGFCNLTDWMCLAFRLSFVTWSLTGTEFVGRFLRSFVWPVCVGVFWWLCINPKLTDRERMCCRVEGGDWNREGVERVWSWERVWFFWVVFVWFIVERSCWSRGYWRWWHWIFLGFDRFIRWGFVCDGGLWRSWKGCSWS